MTEKDVYCDEIRQFLKKIEECINCMQGNPNVETRDIQHLSSFAERMSDYVEYLAEDLLGDGWRNGLERD